MMLDSIPSQCSQRPPALTRAVVADFYGSIKMNGIIKFVCGGGWVKFTETGRPVTRWLVVAAFGTCCLSAVTADLLIPLDSPTLWRDLFSFPSFLILLPSPTLAISAIVAYFIEQPRAITKEIRDPHYDPHNLY